MAEPTLTIRQQVVQTLDVVEPPRLSILSEHAQLYDEVNTITRAVTSTGATVTLLLTDVVLLINSAGNNTVVQLPAAGLVPDRQFWIKKTDRSTFPNGKLSITPAGTETIDGTAGPAVCTVGVEATRDGIHLISDGTSWHILGYYTGPIT
jgi:hypothetical protein